MKTGADDYLVKPFAMEELEALRGIEGQVEDARLARSKGTGLILAELPPALPGK